ncbi:gamma-mobile-trio integrase GmtZ [Acinetobacter baumannii]|uniref:gamma-mobile-trio integrase GmtZ n=1 Tax=Acinetobacter baumannii TaxID=470 RepID=UPI000452E9AE|nr:VPA1269 family protein [Acinetobacter baumannii]EXG32770.1 phage integrase family protein [Acinetobacter baumannii 121738]QMS81221.1 tyrosine-type recombinase/integrase [Acinetobacter baumannii]HEP1385217.1 tyrosine-type recombinase/integrase [Acinetobacter baumannii]
MIKPQAIKQIENKRFNSKFPTLESLKQTCKSLGITNSVIYKEKYKEYGLPAHPERIYEEWVSYKDFFDIVEFISYAELQKLVIEKNLTTLNQYKKFVKQQNDPSLPLDLEGVYKNEWKNSYNFFGKDEPFKPDFISPEYITWAIKIKEFMTTARGGDSKKTHLCRFVRLYIERIDQSKTPHAFLMQEKFDVKSFRDVLANIESEPTKRKLVVAVNEFLDYIINNDLTIEDEETGEIVRVENARNPFSFFLTQQNISSSSIRSETTKPCLQYHFVKKAQEWIIPTSARCFQDLEHLHNFDADWIKVDFDQLDPYDPECVYRIENNQAYLWCPTDWIHTYALTKVPLRGRQIAYNDSGEADEYIAELDSQNKVIWQKNTSPLSGMTKEQSFIKKMPDGQIGMFTTTNKTNNNGQGYTIPWMPEDLAYWLVKLRQWQQKYNPINRPSEWKDCERTNLNELQRIAKGLNCFLFRRFNDFEPAAVSNALTPRLAAALWNIQPSNLTLTTLEGNPATLGCYKSKYTPHSMRVSLITAYVTEMGMPIEIVMKIVGHSSVIMSIYYCKVSNSDIRKKLEEGEKIALKSEAESIQKTIEQNKIEDVKNQLIGNNSELLQALSNEVPAGNYVFRDYGICPFAASRCEDGGETIKSSSFYTPTPQGYLGIQNCLRCRHFITGPAFIGGLLAITNEILLQSNDQSDICAKLQLKINMINEGIDQLEKEEYSANLKQQKFEGAAERSKLETDLRNFESEYETAAKKLDMLLCDIQAAYSYITKCHKLINNDVLLEDSNKLSLITTANAELVLELEEVSHYQQLQEVCENAVIYKSCHADQAIYPRTQLIDKMALFNGIMPKLFTLSKDQQLSAGNQIFKLLMSRLKSWDKIQKVIEGEIKLIELSESEKISKSEIELILHNSPTLIETSYDS